MANFFLVSLVAYLIGSLPTAYLLVKKITGQDIRQIGSGNIGAMNTARALKEKSKKLAVIGFLVVLIADMAKGAFSVFFAEKIFTYSQYSYSFVDPGPIIPVAPIIQLVRDKYQIRYANTGSPAGETWEVVEFLRELRDIKTQGS